MLAVNTTANAEDLASPVFFQETHGQHEPLIDNVGISDNQGSARWNTGGSLSAWWCSSEEFPSNGQRHDAIYTATVQPGQSELDPQVALHSAGGDPAKHNPFDALNICSLTIIDRPMSNEADWTLLYYECSPVIFDVDNPNHPPGGGNPMGSFVASFVQVCLARLTTDGWRLYNETGEGDFVPPIDGQVGVWVGSTLFETHRYFEYSLDGVNFQAASFSNPSSDFLLVEANPGYLCPAPGAGSFVSDSYGHVQGQRSFGLLSGKGFLRTSERGIEKGCHHQNEEDLRGSTWALYYLEGDFTDVDTVNHSCEEGELSQPQGRVSEGTTLPEWTVDNPNKTCRNWIDKQETGDVFPMPSLTMVSRWMEYSPVSSNSRVRSPS